MKAKLIKIDDGQPDGGFYIIRDLNGDPIESKLSLKNCQAIERGYDLDELAWNQLGNGTAPPGGYLRLSFIGEYESFIRGFQKALELMGDKKFSEEDVISMIEKSRETGLTAEYLLLTKQQNEWDVEVEMTCVMGCENLILNGENSVCCGNKKPNLDSNGCLILKKI